jgi:two-component system, NarL family, response regulator NreC
MRNPSGVDADANVDRGEEPDADGPRVLLVDDNLPLRRQLNELLTDYGIRVVGEAANGSDGLALSERLNPDVVIMDYRMPGNLNGIAMTRELTSRLPRIRVVMLSVYDDPALISQARDAGAVAYVVKGTPTVHLVDALTRAWGDRGVA